MNNVRRKMLDEIVSRIESLKDELENIMSEEEEYRDNIPENLQGSEKYQMAEAACDSISYALDSMDEAISNIEEAKG